MAAHAFKYYHIIRSQVNLRYMAVDFVCAAAAGIADVGIVASSY